MAKYRRSARGGSFRPEQVSGQGEARLQEYSNRIVNGLREERDAIISNRNDIADAMKENAQIESDQASTNNKIEQQNLDSKLRAIQAENDASMRQFEINNKAQGEIFRNISNLSLTAGKKLQEIEIERLHEQWKNDYYEVMLLGNNAPSVKALTAGLKESDALTVQADSEVNVLKQNGADPLEISELSKQIRNMSYGTKLATYEVIGRQYGSFLREQLMDDVIEYTDSKGSFKGNESARNAERAGIVTAASMQRFLDLSNLTGVNPALLQKSGLLDTMLRENQRVMQIAREGQIEDNNTQEDITFKNGFRRGTPADQRSFIENNFVSLVNRKGLKGALDFLTEEAEVVDENGNPLSPPAALLTAKIGSNGEPFEESFPRRAAQIRRTIVNAKNAAFRAEEETRRIQATQAFRSIRDGLVAQLAAAGAREDLDILATAKKELNDRFGYTPPELTDLERQILTENKQEAQQKLEAVQQLARDGQLTQGAVLSIQDPTMRAQAQELLNEQNKASNFGRDYQETLKGLKQDAKLIAKDSLEGGSSSSAVEVQLFMERQFAAWYKEGLRLNNNDPTAALAYARQNHQAELAKSKAGDKDGLYFREYGDNNGSVYPNIRKEKARTSAAIDANIQRIENTIGSLGAGALNSPGLVMNARDLRNVSQTHYTGGSIGQLITPEVKAAARLLNVSEMEVINRQIDAYNKFNEDKINRIESPSLDLVNKARPETQRLFTDIPTFTSVYRGAATIGGTLNNNLRSTFSQSLNASGNPTSSDQFIVAIGINEGTRTADGGTTAAYARHVDPGDKGLNRGTFSYDPARFGTDPNMTPEQADAAYMPNLVAANNKYAPILKQMGYVEGTAEYGVAMFNILDLTVQAPLAVDDFVNTGLRKLAGQPLTKENVGDARAYAFYNPRTGQLEAGGFNNDFERLRADQRSRAMTILTGQRN